MLRRWRRAKPTSSCFSRAVTALTLALALATPATSAEAAPKRKTGATSEDPIEQGEEALARKDYEEAIAKFNAAYYGLPTDERASYVGSIPVRKAMEAYELWFAEAQDPAILQRQLALVKEFLKSVESSPEGVDQVGKEVVSELQAVRDAVEKKLADISSPTIVEPEPKPEPEPDEVKPEPDPKGTPATNGTTGDDLPDPRPARSRVGIGLAAAGGVVLGTGAGVMAGWWTVRNQATEYADNEPGYEEGTPERAAYLRREEDRARKYLISGTVVMGVGAAVAVTGVVLIALHGRRGKQTPVAFAPQFDPHHAGFAISGRF